MVCIITMVAISTFLFYHYCLYNFLSSLADGLIRLGNLFDEITTQKSNSNSFCTSSLPFVICPSSLEATIFSCSFNEQPSSLSRLPSTFMVFAVLSAWLLRMLLSSLEHLLFPSRSARGRFSTILVEQIMFL